MGEPETRTEKYILKLKEGRGNAEEVIEKVRRSKVDDLENTRIELEIEKMKTEIKKLQGEGQSVQPQQAQGLVTAIIAQNFTDPKKAQEFLSSLDEESLNKMALLLAADSPRAEVLTNLMRSPTSNIKDLIEIVKLVTTSKGEGTSLKDMAAVFTTAIEYAKANMPPPKNEQNGFEQIYEKFLKPLQDTLATKDKEVWEARLKSIEDKIVNPVEWFKSQKAIAGELGLSSGGSEKLTEINLTLEGMRQRHDIDMESIRWEKEKFLLGKESDVEKWNGIKDMFNPIFQMPEIRDTIRNIGAGVGKSIAGATNPNAPASNPATTQPQIVSFVCPSCNAELSVPLPPNAPEEVPIKCPKCGTITPARLSKPASETAPQEEKPHSTRLKAAYT